MDIVEFAERFMGVELKEWQKEHLRILEKLPRDAKIVMAPRGRVYVYMNQTVKENANGHEIERQPARHSGYTCGIYAHDELDRTSSRS